MSVALSFGSLARAHPPVVVVDGSVLDISF
jgi:hypothetical protein